MAHRLIRSEAHPQIVDGHGFFVCICLNFPDQLGVVGKQALQTEISFGLVRIEAWIVVSFFTNCAITAFHKQTSNLIR